MKSNSRISPVFTLVVVAVFLLTISVGAQDQKTVSPLEKENDRVTQNVSSIPNSATELKTDREKQSYALGMNVASQVRSKSMVLDLDLVVRGLKDSLSGEKTLLNDLEVRAAIAQLRQEVKQKTVAMRREKLEQKASQQEAQGANLQAPTPGSSTPATSLSDFRISYKMDARLSGPTYGGERWVVSSKFTGPVQTGKEATVEAKVDGVASSGASIAASAEWKPEDAGMVTVVPGENKQVKITVHHPGETKLTVASNGISKQLVVKAKSLANGNATQVEISDAQ
jgi:Domain amino terminal to FKBP-type peptidyl-prolyl isomerase